MTDLHFRATTQRAFATVMETLSIEGSGVNIDTIAPGSIVQTKAVLDRDGKVVTPAVTDANWHFNVRLPVSVDAEQIKSNFGRLANATQKTVASQRRIGTDHTWTSVTNADGEVWLIDPAPAVPSRIWLGDAAPAVGRG